LEEKDTQKKETALRMAREMQANVGLATVI